MENFLDYTITPFDPAGYWEIEQAVGAQPTEPTAAELQQVETVLTAAIAQVNGRTERAHAAHWAASPHGGWGREQALIDLPRYVRQYVAFVVATGERLVWVQLLRYPHPDWRTQLRRVLNGSNAYVSATVNPATGTLLPDYQRRSLKRPLQLARSTNYCRAST